MIEGVNGNGEKTAKLGVRVELVVSLEEARVLEQHAQRMENRPGYDTIVTHAWRKFRQALLLASRGPKPSARPAALPPPARAEVRP